MDKRTVTIMVGGHFDFSVHKPFREAYRNTDGNNLRYVIDLRDINYIDSSALGMLLVLREHAGGDAARVRIINTAPAVNEILTIANFPTLFDMS